MLRSQSGVWVIALAQAASPPPRVNVVHCVEALRNVLQEINPLEFRRFKSCALKKGEHQLIEYVLACFITTDGYCCYPRACEER